MSKNDHQIDSTDPKDYEEHTRPNMFSRAIRLIVIGVIIVVFLALALTSAPKNQDLNSIRDERTILGNKNAKNHYVMVTDVMCPYCTVFSRLTLENQEKFEKYLKDHDIVFELRVTDFLSENNMDHYGFSRMSAEAVACATEQNRFWDYYHQVLVLLKMRQPSRISLPHIGRVLLKKLISTLPLMNVYLNIKC